MNERIPFVGASVHFVMPLPNGQAMHIAAVITALAEGKRNDAMGHPSGEVIQIAILTLFKPQGIDFAQQAEQDEVGKMPGTFHFPETPSRIRIAGGVNGG